MVKLLAVGKRAWALELTDRRVATEEELAEARRTITEQTRTSLSKTSV